MNSRRVLATLLALGMVGMIGCTSESTTPVEPAQPQAEPIQRATISGKIIDMCTNDAIAGAVMSLGHDGSVQTVTSDASGSFSFADVPVDQYQILSGTTCFNIHVSHCSFPISLRCSLQHSAEDEVRGGLGHASLAKGSIRQRCHSVF